MARNTSVTLGEPYLDFIDRQIAKGRFATASEAVRAGLRLREEQEIAMEKLRAAIDEGDASPDSPDFDFDTFVARMKRQ
jgi:antitoxin ParD1/3/4